jgi:hypothetical protein
MALITFSSVRWHSDKRLAVAVRMTPLAQDFACVKNNGALLDDD